MPSSPKAVQAAREFMSGIPEATQDDVLALRAAAKVKLGRQRIARLQILLGRRVTLEQLARRPVSRGEPFRL